MKVKNLTPLLFGTCVTARIPPQPEVVAIVRGLFTLVPGERAKVRLEPAPFPQGFMAGDTFRDGDDDRSGELVYPSDFAAYKPRADVLLKGTAHAPGGSPAAELGVKIAVGSWSKSLRVVGPRVFSDSMAGAAISAPLAFTEVPLDYTNSFGGPGYAQNPVGKGFTTMELPNIEAAGAPVRSRRDRLEPAGFGPVNPMWPQRRRKLGKEYGRSWAESRAPYYAEDFDWTYFNAAPEDQQLSGYLRGDEDLALYNLHPSVPVFASRLPGLRARVFIKDTERRFREIPMHLDTLLVDMNAGTVALTWRGHDKVREDDLADIKTALVASEPLAEVPLAVDHYRGILEQFEADPLELKERVPEEYRQFVDPAMAFAPTEPAPPPESVQAVLEQRLGTAARPEQEQIKKLIERVAAASKPAADIEPILAKAAREAPPKAPPPLRSAKPGAVPPVRLREAVQAVEKTVQGLKRAAAERGITIKNIAELEKLSSDPRLLAMDPSLAIGAKAPQEPGPGQDLSGQDLRGRDLRGRDLRGANFTGALLSEANLDGALLSGANFKLAILFSASLVGADLNHADMTMANLAGARAERVVLRGAKLEQTLFDEADLTGAVLAEATAESAFFTNCRMNDLKAARARFTQVFVEGSTLERADFSEAQITRSRFLRSLAVGARLDGATLTKTSFSDSNFTEASFTDIRAEASIWLRTVIARADFSYATLIGAHLTEAAAQGAKFNAANLKQARLYRAKLDGANFTHANLFEADLCKTSLAGVKFTGANLYGARLLHAAGAGTDFTGANIKRSTLERVQ